ncbi:MAG: hypothetical protein ACREMP_08060 [Candidatus Tyrphobacter sp.]
MSGFFRAAMVSVGRAFRFLFSTTEEEAAFVHAHLRSSLRRNMH